MSDQQKPVCREIVVLRGQGGKECGRPAKERLHPGNNPVCGIHARAHAQRGGELSPL